jgi:hypothetical protein
MTEKEIKEINKESFSKVLKNLKNFLLLALSDQEADEFIEINELNISFRYLQSINQEKML